MIFFLVFFIVCEYYVHETCQELSVPNCKECATYFPGRELSNVRHIHHWREGNLLSSSKCAVCKKSCWSSECLSGYRWEIQSSVLIDDPHLTFCFSHICDDRNRKILRDINNSWVCSLLLFLLNLTNCVQKSKIKERSMCSLTLPSCIFLSFAYRCEWCGITAHPACHKSIPPECNFGVLEPIYLPPHCVSIPRTEISMETILGVAKKSRETAANIRKKITPTLKRFDGL